MTPGQHVERMVMLREMLGVLHQMRDLLMLVAVPPPDPDGCQHPNDQRTSLATPGDPDHWACKVCRHEHHGVRRTATM